MNEEHRDEQFELNAMMYAFRCHEAVNHRYGGDANLPYSVHLAMVVNAGEQFMHFIPESQRSTVRAAEWCHDVIEDTRQSYNDVRHAVGYNTAELVYAVTNEKGKNRSERANHVYYTGIRQTVYAPFVKFADRIANKTFSKYAGDGRMYKMYCEEDDELIASIIPFDNAHACEYGMAMGKHLKSI